MIPVLQALQNKYGYLFPEALSVMAKELKLSEHEIYGVATFYAQFRFTKPGEHLVRVCLGTACYVRGSELLLDSIKTRLNIKPGETSADGKFSLERVACMGCCALAPVVVVDGEVHGKMNQSKLADRLDKFKTERKRENVK